LKKEKEEIEANKKRIEDMGNTEEAIRLKEKMDIEQEKRKQLER
jgi:hypothetical protein